MHWSEALPAIVKADKAAKPTKTKNVKTTFAVMTWKTMGEETIDSEGSFQVTENFLKHSFILKYDY